MMKIFSPALVSCLLLLIGCNTIAKKGDYIGSQLIAAPEEDAIKAAVNQAYGAISFKQGEKVDYKRIKKCFMPQAQMFNFRNDTLSVLSIDQFVEGYKGLVETNGITTFYEEEIKGTTDQFGRIAQRLSTYKTYINSMDTVAERGVNSFQLIKTPEGWKISSIIWDVETSKLPIPSAYLKTASLK